jgi:hypothetical protein
MSIRIGKRKTESTYNDLLIKIFAGRAILPKRGISQYYVILGNLQKYKTFEILFYEL